MENNKRTIFPISSEEEVKASIEQTVATNTGNENSFTTTENQSPPEFSNDFPVNENQLIGSAGTPQDGKKGLNKRKIFSVAALVIILLGLGSYGVIYTLNIANGSMKQDFKNFAVKADDYTYNVDYYSDAKDICLHDCNHIDSHHLQRSGMGGMGFTVSPMTTDEAPHLVPYANSDQCPGSNKKIQIDTTHGEINGCIDSFSSLSTLIIINEYLAQIRFNGNKFTNFESIKDELSTILSSLTIAKAN